MSVDFNERLTLRRTHMLIDNACTTFVGRDLKLLSSVSHGTMALRDLLGQTEALWRTKYAPAEDARARYELLLADANATFNGPDPQVGVEMVREMQDRMDAALGVAQ